MAEETKKQTENKLILILIKIIAVVLLINGIWLIVANIRPFALGNLYPHYDIIKSFVEGLGWIISGFSLLYLKKWSLYFFTIFTVLFKVFVIITFFYFYFQGYYIIYNVFLFDTIVRIGFLVFLWLNYKNFKYGR